LKPKRATRSFDHDEDITEHVRQRRLDLAVLVPPRALEDLGLQPFNQCARFLELSPRDRLSTRARLDPSRARSQFRIWLVRALERTFA